MDLKQCIRSVPNFPKEGILFFDITTVLENADAFRYAVDWLAEKFKDSGATKVCAAEARGFTFASALAYKLGWGMVPIRKPGKLPYATISQDYELEYGTATLHIHKDAVKKDEKVLLVDDLLGTGGTAEAMVQLVERLGGAVVGLGFIVELDFLPGRSMLKNYRVESLVHYKSEKMDA